MSSRCICIGDLGGVFVFRLSQDAAVEILSSVLIPVGVFRGTLEKLGQALSEASSKLPNFGHCSLE